MNALEAACSRYVGIVTEVDGLLAGPADSRLTHLVAVGARGPQRFEAGGAGYSADPATARAAAIGEAIERYSAALPPALPPPAAAADVDGAVAPERFALFADEQYSRPGFPFVPFTRRTPVRWTPGRSLADGSRALLPAQLVYLAWDALPDGEPAIAHATSSGLACGASYAEAALAALLELVERDAFMLVWRNRLSLPQIDARRAHGVVAWERHYLDGARLRRRVVDLSCIHGLPTLLAVVEDAAGSLGVGAAAATSPDAAYRKALAEAYATQGAARRMRQDGTSRRTGFEDIATFADHIAVYADPRNAVRAAFLTASPARVQLERLPCVAPAPPEQQLELVARALLGAGVESYAVDVTTPDIAALGLCVVKAVAPELCLLDVRQDACFLGGRRLRQAPVDLGLRTHELAIHELNLDPHPFP